MAAQSVVSGGLQLKLIEIYQLVDGLPKLSGPEPISFTLRSLMGVALESYWGQVIWTSKSATHFRYHMSTQA